MQQNLKKESKLLSETSEHFLQRPCDEEVRRRIQDTTGLHDAILTMAKNRSEIQMVRPHLKILLHGEDSSAEFGTNVVTAAITVIKVHCECPLYCLNETINS